MASIPSRLRSDLVVTRQDTPDGVAYIFKDPVNGHFYRFKAVEHYIARLLDGERSLADVQRAVEAEFDAPLALPTLERFLAMLREHGLLDTGRPVEPAAQRVWNARNPYSLRLRLYNPDRLLGALARPFAFLFTPAFVVAAILLVLQAGVATFLDWPRIVADFRHLGIVEAVAIGWATVLLVGIAHEFAHGLTCKHFGGEVRDMGFLFIYLHPALYCNVSDSWMFAEKSKRFWVMFAGTFLELTVWALATLCWRLTETGTFANTVALAIIVTSGIKVLLNLNPLLKLDGYYILSDALAIPNLRSRSFRYIRRRLGLERGGDEMPVTPRERRVFTLYGVVASTFTIALLVAVTWRAGGFLMGRYQAWGLLLFAAVLPFLFRYRLRRLLPGSPLPAAPRAGVRAAIANPRPLLWTALAATVLLAVGSMPLRIGGDFSVLPIHNADVRAEVDGIVSEALVHEGDIVRRGQPIARLSPRDVEAELEKTSADLVEAGARLELLRAGHRREEIALAHEELRTAQTRREQAEREIEVKARVRTDELERARGAVKLAQERLEYAQNNVDRSRKLVESQVISARDYETVAEQAAMRERELASARSELHSLEADNLTSERRELAVAQGAVNESRQKFQLLRAGSRPQEVEATAAQRARLEAQRHYLEEQVRLTTLVSPIDGVVTTPERQLRELPGQFVGRGDLVAEVHDIRSVTVEINVPEREIEDVHVGQPVVLKARAYPDHVFRGTVTAIAATAHGAVANNAPREAAVGASAPSDARQVVVRTRIPNPDLLLKPDMTGRAKITCGKRSLIDLMTRRFARAVRLEFWSWW